MSADQRVITRDDIMDPVAYALERKQRRTALLPRKKIRRIDVGPHATFYFESYETMWFQIHEMLHIEKGGEDQIKDELAAYNPLIPQGAELVATLMFEINDEQRRLTFLKSIAGVEKAIYFEVAGAKSFARPEEDVERTTPDGKTSSVHFLHFDFAKDQMAAIDDGAARVTLAIEHKNYAHMTMLSAEARAELATDFG
jgi:hypothetical protein